MLPRTGLFLHATAATHFRTLGARKISSEIAKASSRILADDQERREFVDSALRVDHAGEFSAVRIYEGQVRLLRLRNAT